MKRYETSKLFAVLGIAFISLVAFGCSEDSGMSSTAKKDCGGACGEGEVCNEDTGKCEVQTVPEPCGGVCGEGQVCNANTGRCEVQTAPEPCGGACGEGLICNEQTGKCEIKPSETLTCPENQKVCGTTCADLTKDSKHCGECDHVCLDGRICVESVCKFVCDNGEEACEDGCHNTKIDKDNCGVCGEKCEEGKECKDGFCVLACEVSETPCEDGCKDTLNDHENCGTCGNKCGEHENCMSGACKLSCDAGEDLCGSVCVNLDNDETCGTSCDNYKKCDVENNEVCTNRECKSLCKEGQILCNGSCVDTNSDKNNCGGCGESFKCGNDEKCNEGSCSIDCGKLVDCNGNCIDPQSHPDYCGATEACDGFAVCGEGLSCQMGECKCTDDSQTKCKVGDAFICTDPKTSTKYCGCSGESAGLDCSSLTGMSSGVCDNGTCKLTCDETHADCDEDLSNGCESDLASPESCGTCGNVCQDDFASTIQCIAGECHYTCEENMTFCNNKCIDSSSDKNNCGACGRKCAENAECVNGFCTIDKTKCDNKGYITTTVNDREIKAYCIKTESAFFDMRDAINAGRVFPDADNKNNAYIIVDDLVFGNQTSWIPVGTSSNPFKNGIFLGNGKKLQGTFTAAGGNNGLFGTVNSSNFYDFNADITMTNTGSTYWNGCLIGYATNSELAYSKVKGTNTGYYGTGIAVGRADGSTISYVSASGTLHPFTHDCAGVVAYSINNTIDHCSADIEMVPQATGPWNGTYGGLVGYGADGTKISNSTATGLINITSPAGKSSIGGLVGIMRNNVSVTKSHASTAIKEEYVLSSYQIKGVGGLVGTLCDSGSACTIEDSFATGDVECKSLYCGGLIGYAYAVGSQIKSSYATGNVTSTNDYVGGIAGFVDNNNKFTNVYATGKVNSDGSYVGGLIGYMQNSTLADSRAEGDVAGNTINSNYVGGAVGRTVGSTITNLYAKGDVSGYGRVGGAIGEIYTNTLKNIGAFGKVTCNVFGTSKGIYAGGLFGVLNSNSNMTNGFSTGNVTCGDHVGGSIGHFNIGNNSVRAVYATGTASGGTDAVGAFGGIIYGGSLSVKNSYYWVNGHTNIIGQGKPVDTTAAAFKYNDEKKAVLTMNEARELVESLGDEWVSATCKISGGPNDTVNIPLPKELGAEICK